MSNIFFTPETKTIYIHEDISSESMSMASYCLNTLLQMDEAIPVSQRTPIRIYINSYGGAIYDMWAFVQLMESSKTPIYTYCTGYAMSAALCHFHCRASAIHGHSCTTHVAPTL